MTKAVTRNWHQYRTVTKNLPLRNKYDPMNTGESSVCYLVDSGVATEHEIFANSKFEKLYSHDGSFEDYHGHGTSMASLINSAELGIAPDSTIKIVDFITKDNDANQARVLDALDAVLQDHLKTKDVTKVVHMPWVVTASDEVDAKVNELAENNLVIVCAAGQNGIDAAAYSPARLDTVVTVGAVDYYDRAFDSNHPWAKSHFASNHGQCVNIFAPGSSIAHADINGYVTTGDGPSTSMSSAIVAGVCLNIVAGDSSLSAADVIEQLYKTSISDIVYITDESQYNTENNRLVYQENEHYREVWSVRGQLAELKSNSGKHELDLAVSADIEAVESEAYAHTPDFVFIDDKRLVVDTDKASQPGKYQFILSAKDKENKFNRNFYIDILDENGLLPEGKEYFTEVDEQGNYTTTNYLEFQSAGRTVLK